MSGHGRSRIQTPRVKPRYVTLGLDPAGRLLLVAWTERAEDVIRIVSARVASPGERRAYSER